MGTNFREPQVIGAVEYTCGWCGRFVAASAGFPGEDDGWMRGKSGGHRWAQIALCPNCRQPTYIYRGQQVPGVRAGDEVAELPPDVAALYDEARSSAGSGLHTASVVVGRKILMHVAVEKGAKENQSFGFYVGWLVSQGIVTTDMKEWIDEIRELGNDANHEIVLMAPDESEALLTFLSMLLKIVYEFPERARQSVAARKARDQVPEEGALPPNEERPDGEPPPVPPPVL